MASSSKKRTPVVKLTRETAVRERRLRKQAEQDAREQVAAAPRNDPGEAPAADAR